MYAVNDVVYCREKRIFCCGSTGLASIRGAAVVRSERSGRAKHARGRRFIAPYSIKVQYKSRERSELSGPSVLSVLSRFARVSPVSVKGGEGGRGRLFLPRRVAIIGSRKTTTLRRRLMRVIADNARDNPCLRR